MARNKEEKRKKIRKEKRKSRSRYLSVQKKIDSVMHEALNARGPFFKPYITGQYSTIKDALSKFRTIIKQGKRLDERTKALMSVSDKLIEDSLSNPNQVQPVCKPGCDFCCKKMRISISEQEAFLIMKSLGSLPTKILKKIKENASFLKATGKDQCALLIGGKCSIYESRPITCRAYRSYSVQECKDHFANGKNISQATILAYPFDDAIRYSFWVASSVREEQYTFELNSFLRHNLCDENRFSEWQRGTLVDNTDIADGDRIPPNRNLISRKNIPLKLLTDSETEKTVFLKPFFNKLFGRN